MPMMKFDEIKKKIEEAESIVIYRHVRADYDAMGSQLGLKYLILDNYPCKKVYTGGADWIDNPDFIEKMNNAEIDLIKNSLVVVLDCGNNERIDGQEYALGKEIIKFDHHHNSTILSDLDCIDENATATCILLTEFAKTTGMKVSKKTAEYLLAGILSDTQNLTISNVSEKDFQLAGFLLSCGAVINEVYRQAFSITKADFSARNHLGAKFSFVENKAYAIFTNEDYQEYHISMLEAKELVDMVREVRGVDQWMLVYQTANGLFNCSLRSHQQPVEPLARRYGGGGHECASGISGLSEEKVKQVIEDFLLY